jgi:hypothetical protein
MSKVISVYIAGNEEKRLLLNTALPSLIPQFRAKVVNEPNRIAEFGKLLVFIPWDYNELQDIFRKFELPVVEYLKARGNTMIVLLRSPHNLHPDQAEIPKDVHGFPLAIVKWSRETPRVFDGGDKFTLQGGMRIQTFLLRELTKQSPSTPAKGTQT